MSTTTTDTRRNPPSRGERVADWADGRLGLHAAGRKNLRKVFPDHWSFMLGEICMYTFLIVLLTGVYLTLFFKPSMAEMTYHGSYAPMNGVTMTEAYASTLDHAAAGQHALAAAQLHAGGAARLG
jgi:ubiquinol-cytochrome c reductase cytochrome b subunit